MAKIIFGHFVGEWTAGPNIFGSSCLWCPLFRDLLRACVLLLPRSACPVFHHISVVCMCLFASVQVQSGVSSGKTAFSRVMLWGGMSPLVFCCPSAVFPVSPALVCVLVSTICVYILRLCVQDLWKRRDWARTERFAVGHRWVPVGVRHSAPVSSSSRLEPVPNRSCGGTAMLLP